MINVLMIEDNPGDARRIRELLRDETGSPIALAHADCLSAAVDYLNANGADLILLDLSLPDSKGFDTFTMLRAKTKELPLILLTGLDDEDLAVRAVRAGAQDYILKESVTGKSLARAIRFAMERPRSYRVSYRTLLLAGEGRD